MTQQKKGKKTTVNTLQQKFLALSQREQMGVTSFFNCHNAASYIYDGLSEEAQAYITYCISLSQNADKIEKQNESAHVS